MACKLEMELCMCEGLRVRDFLKSQYMQYTSSSGFLQLVWIDNVVRQVVASGDSLHAHCSTNQRFSDPMSI